MTNLLDATVLCHGPREFSRVFWHFLMHGETIIVKLPIEESMVKLLPSASSLCFSYYLTPFAQSSFIKRMHLTRDG